MKEPEFETDVFFEMTPDLVCVAGKDGFFKKVNPAVIDKLGYTLAELMASPIATFVYPEDKLYTKQRRGELLSGKALINFQNRYVKKTGEIVWLEWTSIYFADREVVFAIAKDITERKMMEIEVGEKYRKFKSLTSHFKSRIEEDRKYLANELQEELTQLATVLKIDLEWIHTSEPDWSSVAKNRIGHALEISKLLITSIRRMSFSISPNILEHLGLNATLTWHCKEFSVLNGIPCHFESSCDDTDLSQETKTDLFRICQESLANALLHAQADLISVMIADEGPYLQMTVQDNGKGFDVDKQLRRSGLIRMRERVASINGELSIESEMGKGTRIRVRLVK